MLYGLAGVGGVVTFVVLFYWVDELLLVEFPVTLAEVAFAYEGGDGVGVGGVEGTEGGVGFDMIPPVLLMT